MTQRASKTGNREYRRHRIVWRVCRVLLGPFIRWKFGYTAEPAPDIQAPILVLANHTTNLDPLFVAMSFKRQMYYIASEHIFRWGWKSKLIVYLTGVMPRVKGRSDVRAAVDIIRKLRAGYNVCVFAEGNRSVDGLTGKITPAAGTLAKGGADLVTYRLEGGYLTNPRWGKALRRGRMYGHVVGHYTAAQLQDMDSAAITEIIRRDLHEDAYARQREHPAAYRGKRIAEHLETALYLCPACGGIGTLKSEGDRFFCSCGLSLRYTEAGALVGNSAPFATITEWCAWQRAKAEERISRLTGEEILRDTDQLLYGVTLCTSETLLARDTLTMTRGALTIGSYTFPLPSISDMAIVGQMTLTFSLDDGSHYELKSTHPRSAYKYLDAFEILRSGQA